MNDEARTAAILDANKIRLLDEIRFLREELTAIRDLAYRGANEHGARDAVEVIFDRASKALNAEAGR
jgi:hypothetical protein